MRNLFTALILAAAAISASAQQLQVATGSASGTYATMFKQLAGRCGNSVALVEIATTGSQDNMERLVGNQVNAAFVQSDVLYLRARTEDLSNIKTLIALHPEQVHLLARSSSGIKTGGTMGFGAKEVVLNELRDLGGRRVGAAGGSTVTAQVVRLQSEVPFNVVPMANEAAVRKALDEGAIDAGLFVGGAPLPFIAGLGAEYKLLSIAPATVEKLKGVYRPARLNYSKMGAAGIATVSTDALFVTRQYKTQRMTDGLAKLRSCAFTELDDLKETTGTHPAWQAIETGNKGKWAWYELPSAK